MSGWPLRYHHLLRVWSGIARINRVSFLHGLNYRPPDLQVHPCLRSPAVTQDRVRNKPTCYVAGLCERFAPRCRIPLFCLHIRHGHVGSSIPSSTLPSHHEPKEAAHKGSLLPLGLPTGASNPLSGLCVPDQFSGLSGGCNKGASRATMGCTTHSVAGLLVWESGQGQWLG